MENKNLVGSPPLTRGQQEVMDSFTDPRGITPAHAGTTDTYI